MTGGIGSSGWGARNDIASHGTSTPFPPDRPGKTEEVSQDILPFLREDGFGMKLDPLQDVIPVSHSHYRSFRSSGSEFETGWQTLGFDNEGMIAHCRKGIGQALIDSLAVVLDERGLAVDRRASADSAPVDVADALMS